MGRKKDISVEEKVRILVWVQKDVKTAEIAAKLGRHSASDRPAEEPAADYLAAADEARIGVEVSRLCLKITAKHSKTK